MKSLFAADIADRNLTPIIASHNLRELEDICDHMGLLHKGGILLSRDLDDMKLNIQKLQCVLQPGMGAEDLIALDKLNVEQRGSLSLWWSAGQGRGGGHYGNVRSGVFRVYSPCRWRNLYQ